ncbi:MAG: HotDog ACOT-type domain-containing protein [Pseudoclavibacter caeni]
MGHGDATGRPADEQTTDQQTDEQQEQGTGRAFTAESADQYEDRPLGNRRHMNFYSRKWVRPEDLNANGTLFGGSLLKWIDEEAAIYAIVQLGNERCVTKFYSEINFVSSAWQGDLIEMGLVATHFGRTSLTMSCMVRNMITRKTILTIDKIVFVNLGPDGKPAPHGYTEITYLRDRIPKRTTAPIPRQPITEVIPVQRPEEATSIDIVDPR